MIQSEIFRLQVTDFARSSARFDQNIGHQAQLIIQLVKQAWRQNTIPHSIIIKGWNVGVLIVFEMKALEWQTTFKTLQDR
jgi:hypothetical protein